MCVCLYVYITYKVSSEDFRYFYQILKVVCDTHTHTHTKLYITSVYILLLKSVVKYILFCYLAMIILINSGNVLPKSLF